MRHAVPRRVSRDGGNEPPPRVFVSSIMENYAQYRDAAVLGIRQAGCEPVRAEDFTARSTSPRTACLDGVRSADALVLILGERYGFVGPSGLSATEEEYNEARKTHRPILVFLQADIVCEPEQRSLVERVQSYVDGHWRKSFRESAELTELVANAVAAMDFADAPFRANDAMRRITSELKWDAPSSTNSVFLRTVWTTLRDEEVIDPLDLDDDGFERALLRLGHDCDPSLFDYKHSKNSVVEASLIRISQGNLDDWREADHFVAVEVNIHGTLVVTQNAVTAEAQPGAIDQYMRVHVIDPSVVRARLIQAWSFAAAWWSDCDPYLRHDPLLYNLGLYNIGSRAFRPPPSRGEPITIPLVPRDSPLIVFDSPRRVSRANFVGSDDEIMRVIRLIERRFRQ